MFNFDVLSIYKKKTLYDQPIRICDFLLWNKYSYKENSLKLINDFLIKINN